MQRWEEENIFRQWQHGDISITEAQNSLTKERFDQIYTREYSLDDDPTIPWVIPVGYPTSGPLVYQDDDNNTESTPRSEKLKDWNFLNESMNNVFLGTVGVVVIGSAIVIGARSRKKRRKTKRSK